MGSLILCLILQGSPVEKVGALSPSSNITKSLVVYMAELTNSEKLKHRRLLQILSGETVRIALV